MKSIKRIALFISCLLLQIGCQGSAESTTDTAKAVVPDLHSDQQSGLESFDDAFIHFRHPKDRKAMPVPPTGTLTQGYLVLEPEAETEIGPEAIIIVNRPTTEMRSIRELVDDYYRSAAKSQVRFLGDRRRVTLKGGSCIAYSFEMPTAGSCTTPDGEDNLCYQVQLQAECQTQSKVLMKINSSTLAYPDEGKPNPRAREQIQVFERLLKSIEFKK